MLLELILLSLAVWRITALFVYDDGPWDVFVRLRDAIGGPLTCFWCTSVWVGFLASSLFWWRVEGMQWVMWGWALSGMAILIDEVRGGECVE